MKTYTIKEIKEQGIWVKCTKENALRLIQAFDWEKYKSYEAMHRSDCFYSWDESCFDSQNSTPSSYIEFNQIDWEERKQIGWKLKKECEQYRTAAMKICNDMPFLENYRWNIHTNSVNANTLQSAGVLELWFEPVYEEVKFKVNDKVIVTKTTPKPHWNERGEYNGKMFEVVSEKKLYGDGEDQWNLHKIMGIDTTISGGMFDDCMRLATTEEIQAAEKIEIGGYEVEISNGTTTISGYEFTKEFWEAALIVSKHQKAKIKIGCSHQFDLPTETIERILSKLK